MDLTFNSIWVSGEFFQYLLLLIPIIYNLVILLLIARKNGTQNKYSKFLLISQIVSLGLIITTFFIPTYHANNINIDADLPILYGLGFLYLMIFVFPLIITQGVALTLYGKDKKDLFGNNLMIGGIMNITYYLSIFMWLFLHGVVYMPAYSFGGVMYDWILYNFTFIIFNILIYVYFIRHSYKTNLMFYKRAGIYGIVLITLLEAFKWWNISFNIFFI